MRINRDKYLNELRLRMNNGMIKVVIGIRRCGKSYLLNYIFYDYLITKGINKNHIISISLDELENQSLLDALTLNEFVKSKIIARNRYCWLIKL